MNRHLTLTQRSFFRTLLALLICLVGSTARTADEKPVVPAPPPNPPAEGPAEAPVADPKLADGMYAKIETTKGTIYCKLFHDKAIRTVENFVVLAEGSRAWTDPVSKEKREKTPFFDGLKFHRIVPEFVVQTGDPLNTGEGGPGWTIPDEYYPELRFDVPGKLAMARTQMPGTAGSQFFITLAPVPMLNDQYTQFGEVVDGMKVVNVLTATDAMKKVTILRIGETATKFDFAAAIKARQEKAKRTPPSEIGEADPAKVPAAGQPVNANIVAHGCMIVYKGAMLEGAYTTLTKEEAQAIATKVVALARAKGADAAQVLASWSDVPTSRPIQLTKADYPALFDPVFVLKTGQIADPVDAPMGFVIIERIEPVVLHASHILLQYKGSARAQTERTKEEAKTQIEALRKRATEGKEDFAALAKEFTDDPTSKDNGGDLGEFEVGTMVPAFEEALVKMKAGDISEVIETPYGFHIIKRLPLAVKPVVIEMPEVVPMPAPAPAPELVPEVAPMPAPAPAEGAPQP